MPVCVYRGTWGRLTAARAVCHEVAGGVVVPACMCVVELVIHDVVSCGGCRFPHGAQFCSSQWLRLTMFCMCVRTIVCMCAYRPGVSPTTHVAVMDSDADGLGMGTGRFLAEVYSTGGAQRTCLAACVAYVHVHAEVGFEAYSGGSVCGVRACACGGWL